jgi:hypothetical protein
MHVVGFAERLRELTPEQWDYQIDIAAPSPRTLAVHAWQWLVCDRQHIHEPDLSRHVDVPEPPDDPNAMCDLLVSEADTWRDMILAMTPEQLNAPRSQFGGYDANVRWFICHMIQNCIYKHGQFSTMYFAFGYDGTAPYSAPFPNPIYAQVRERDGIATP